MSALDIDELHNRAQELERNSLFTTALQVRERLLLVMQPVFGDPSPETDEQKVLLCKLILKVVDIRDNCAATGKPIPVGKAGAPTKASETSLNYSSQTKKQQHLLTENLSTHGLLAFGERLLGPGNTLPETQEDLHVLEVRAKLLLGIGQVLHRQKRPRAAIPVVQRALALLRKGAGDERVSVDISSAHLTLSALHSASGHHKDALFEAHCALEVILLMEDKYWELDPASAASNVTQQQPQQRKRSKEQSLRQGTGGSEEGSQPSFSIPPLASESATPRKQSFDVESEPGSPAASPTNNRKRPETEPGNPLETQEIYEDDDEEGEDEPEEAAPSSTESRKKIYFGALQAACYHNISTEQEHLGLFELALESCQTGFELAYLTYGEKHPLAQRLKKTYAELFTSLHFKHFHTKKYLLGDTFDDPHAAVAKLNETYLNSLKHREALAREVAVQEQILAKALPSVSKKGLSNSQIVLSGKLRPSSAAAARKYGGGGGGDNDRSHYNQQQNQSAASRGNASTSSRRPMSAMKR